MALSTDSALADSIRVNQLIKPFQPNNTMKKRLLIAALTVPALSLAPITSLADTDDGSALYVGLGASLVDIDEAELDFDDSDATADIRVGYMFTNSLGLEIGYQDLGNFSEGNAELDLDAYSAALVANIPLNNFDLYGKLGANRINGELTINGNSIADEDDTNLFFGGGAELDMGSFNLFTEYTITKFDNDNVDTDIQRVTAGIKIELPQ